MKISDRSWRIGVVASAAIFISACNDKADPNAFKKGTTMEELKAQSAAIARKQQAAEAAAAARDTRTALSRTSADVTLGMRRAEVIALLGTPSNVITPGKLKANDIDRGPNIEYVLTWDNPGCSRIEMFFNARDQVSGTDQGRMCDYPLKPLAPAYSCAKPNNAKYCS